ncbi:restriction endonuclease subunit S [Enterococcus faecium]|nr:restriction endonuclease subunit S [Enterococcus faecium]
MSNETQPEIRFPGFTGDWEQRKLGDVLSERNDQTPETNEYPLMSFVQGKGVTPKGERYNRSFLVKDSEKKYKKTELGDFIYSSNNLETGSIGFNRTGKAVISPVYSIFKSKKSRESQFIGIMSARKDFISKMVRFRQGVVYGQWRIHESDFLNIDTKMPNDKEQQLIISFFENIDKTIALHQRKLDLLKETKKGFLQKMFPKNGAKVPEIRFPGFTGDWEQRKFGEIVQVSRGLTYKPSDVQIDGIRVLRSSNINEDVFILRDDDVFVKPDAVNIAPIKNGDILITSANGSSRLVGKHAIVNGLQDKTVHGGFMLRVKSKNTWFTNSLMSSRWYNYFINIYVSGGNGAIGNLRKYDLESQTIIVPDDEEQQKIGAFFKQLDDTIALHQRKLDLLKETKKGFLQKMFV